MNEIVFVNHPMAIVFVKDLIRKLYFFSNDKTNIVLRVTDRITVTMSEAQYHIYSVVLSRDDDETKSLNEYLMPPQD